MVHRLVRKICDKLVLAVSYLSIHTEHILSHKRSIVIQSILENYPKILQEISVYLQYYKII